MIMTLPQALISDADGTLIDTLHLIRQGQFETAKAYLIPHGILEGDLPDYETYEKLLHLSIGGSARTTLEKTVRLLYEHQPHHLEGMDFDALHALLNPIQDRIAPDFVRPYPGLSDMLTRLGELQIRFAIFTSGTPHHIVRNFGIALPELGLADLYTDTGMPDDVKLCILSAALQEHYKLPAFAAVTCDETSAQKPDPVGLEIAMRKLDVLPEATWFLGDHAVDMQAGVHAHVAQRVGITHGFDSREALLDAGATRVIDSLGALLVDL